MHYATLLPFFAAIAAAEVHTIQVGPGQAFSPETTSATVGDTLVFELHPNHDVAEGPFSSPCRASDNGFYSGGYGGSDNGQKKFVVNVTSTDPIFFYCTVRGHCQNGMVGGINVNADGTQGLSAYASAARNADSQTPSEVRGGQLLNDAQISALTASGSASPTASASGAASSAQATTSRAASGTASAAVTPAPSSTGAAVFSAPAQISGVAAFVFGVAAWFL